MECTPKMRHRVKGPNTLNGRGMDLARRMYSRELKVAAMREIDSGRRISEVARQLERSPRVVGALAQRMASAG